MAAKLGNNATASRGRVPLSLSYQVHKCWQAGICVRTRVFTIYWYSSKIRSKISAVNDCTAVSPCSVATEWFSCWIFKTMCCYLGTVRIPFALQEINSPRWKVKLLQQSVSALFGEAVGSTRCGEVFIAHVPVLLLLAGSVCMVPAGSWSGQQSRTVGVTTSLLPGVFLQLFGFLEWKKFPFPSQAFWRRTLWFVIKHFKKLFHLITDL